MSARQRVCCSTQQTLPDSDAPEDRLVEVLDELEGQVRNNLLDERSCVHHVWIAIDTRDLAPTHHSDRPAYAGSSYAEEPSSSRRSGAGATAGG